MKKFSPLAVVVNDTSYELHHGSRLVMKNLVFLLNQHGFRIIKSFPVGKNWKKSRSLIESIDLADIIIVNGEGTIHHSQPPAYNLVELAPYCKKKNKPVVLLNSTCHANNADIANMISMFDLIFVREELSKKELATYNIHSTVVPDLTFFIPSTHCYSDNNKIIGYTDSVFKELSYHLDMSLTKENYQFFPILCKPHVDKRKWFKSILRVSYFYSELNKAKLKKYFNNNLSYTDKLVLHVVNNSEIYKHNLSQLKFLVTARYHALCFALQAHIPFIAIGSNSHKMQGLLQDIKLSHKRLLDHNDKFNPHLIADNLYFTDGELSEIKHYLDRAPIKINNMFTEIRNLVPL